MEYHKYEKMAQGVTPTTNQDSKLSLPGMDRSQGETALHLFRKLTRSDLTRMNYKIISSTKVRKSGYPSLHIA